MNCWHISHWVPAPAASFCQRWTETLMSHHAIGLYHHDRTSSGAKFRKRPPQKTRPSAANMVKPQRPPRLSKQAKKRDTYLYVQSCERLLDCLSQLDLPCRDAPELETRLRIHVTFESVPHTRHAYSWCETRRSGGCETLPLYLSPRKPAYGYPQLVLWRPAVFGCLGRPPTSYEVKLVRQR